MLRLLLSALLLLFSAQGLCAVVTISNWSITDSSLYFELTGTGNTSSLATFNTYNFNIGDPGNNTWINTSITVNSAYVTGTIDGAVADKAGLQPDTDGDYLLLTRSGGLDLRDGGLFNVTVNFSDLPANTLNPANIDVQDVIVAMGWNTSPPFPDPTFDVGTSAIPEPSSYALALGLIALVCIRFRQRAS